MNGDSSTCHCQLQYYHIIFPNSSKHSICSMLIPQAQVLARTALVKTVRPQPLPAKILVIGCLGIAANVPLRVWREHTKKFSLSWFTAVHAAVPFIAMLRKSVLMPKTAMAITIAGSILGQIIGSRAESAKVVARASSPAGVSGYRSVKKADVVSVGYCGKEIAKISSPSPPPSPKCVFLKWEVTPGFWPNI